MKPQIISRKKKRELLLLFALSLLTILLLNACQNSVNSLNIAAASSLTDVFTEIGQKFEEDNPNMRINFNLAATGILVKQIENKAPIDIFASASEFYMNQLVQKDLIITESKRKIAENQLVIITNKQNNISFQAINELGKTNFKYLALGNPQTVPAGTYAQIFLSKINLFNKLKEEKRLVFGENVRQVLSYIEQGNAELALVYATDALISDKVKIIYSVPFEYTAPITYPIAIIKNSKQVKKAEEFINLVLSKEGQKILTKYGFKIS